MITIADYRMQKLPPRTTLNACWRWRQNINRDGTRRGKNRRNAWSRIYRSVSSTTTSDRYHNTPVQSMDPLCNHKPIPKVWNQNLNFCLILDNPFCNLHVFAWSVRNHIFHVPFYFLIFRSIQKSMSYINIYRQGEVAMATRCQQQEWTRKPSNSLKWLLR